MSCWLKLCIKTTDYHSICKLFTKDIPVATVLFTSPTNCFLWFQRVYCTPYDTLQGTIMLYLNCQWSNWTTYDKLQGIGTPYPISTSTYTWWEIHCIAGGEPAVQAAKYIYAYHHTKDVLVSNYHFTGKFLPHNIPWSIFFELWLSPDSCYASSLNTQDAVIASGRAVALLIFIKFNPFTGNNALHVGWGPFPVGIRL